MAGTLRADVWKARHLSATEKLVLMALAERVDRGVECRPALAEIAGECRFSAGAVRRVLWRLERRGILSIEVGGGKVEGGGPKTSLYTVRRQVLNDVRETEPETQ